MNGRAWSASDIKTLRQMAYLGYTAQEIADELGRTPRSVYRKVARIGISLTQGMRPDPIKRSEVVNLCKGMSGCAIARLTGKSSRLVNRWLKEYESLGDVRREGGGCKVRWYKVR